MNNPAVQASEKALREMFCAIESKICFRMEAGAGAGKTYSLIEALRYLIKRDAESLIKNNQQIACITYTNIAKDEIKERTDFHPVIYAETIHSFSWDLIRQMQKTILKFIPNISDKWKVRIDEAGGIEGQLVKYDLGYPSATKNEISLHHDDVIKIMAYCLEAGKFKRIVQSRFPVIFIDEYQDTNKELAESIVRNLIDVESNILIGFFGDHWQKIYGSNACGLILDKLSRIREINKNANFRSQKNIVNVLNRMRPELTQCVADPNSKGDIYIFHSNMWNGGRQTGAHWAGDLPSNDAHCYLDKTQQFLKQKGWDFNKTKILMLTNNVLAEEQGYRNLASIFKNTDDYLKPDDPYIAFFHNILEPVCELFQNKEYGKMFQAIGTNTPRLNKFTDKKAWTTDLNNVFEMRKTSTIGDIIEQLHVTKHPRLSVKIEEKEIFLRSFESLSDDEKKEKESLFDRISRLKKIPYKEMIALSKYIDDRTPFSTKHGVKGAEFENVLVVCGRGWNQYNWDNMLEWVANGIPSGKEDTFERNRNLFYVSCSRPKSGLAVLFTQKLSAGAILTLEKWFGKDNIIEEPQF